MPIKKDKKINRSSYEYYGALLLAALCRIYPVNFCINIITALAVVFIIIHVSFRSGWTIKRHIALKYFVCVVMLSIWVSIMWHPLNKQWIEKHPGKKIADSNTTPKNYFTKQLPGLSIHTLIRINNIPEKRKKYLYDFGKIGGERLSIYMSPSNLFTVNLIDAKGEDHLMQIPSNTTNGIPIGTFFLLSCEIGIGSKSTFMHVMVNGREVDTRELPFTTDIKTFDFHKGVIGADLNTNNMGSFDEANFILFLDTFTPEDMTTFKQLFTKHPLERFIEFNGKKWMRSNKAGNALEQKDPRFRPEMRDFNGNIVLQ